MCYNIIGDDMETIKSYFSYNDDYSKISKIYYNLSLSLKDIHNDGKVVSNLSSDTSLVGDKYGYSTVDDPVSYEAEKRKNVVSFSKMMLGTYLSLSTGFTDFSQVPDDFFFNNIEEICDSITADNFYPEYFYGVFKEGKNEYFCDFIERKKQEQALNGRSNVNSYKKVLSNAASSLYYDQSEEEFDVDDPNKKQALVHTLFYPMLIVGSLIVLGLTAYLINLFV